MSGSARVTSIGVLQLVQSSLQKFRGESSAALDDLSAEIRRVSEWIHNDRKEYWTRELRRRWEAVSQARLQLQQARSSRRVAGREADCIDEERALDRAKRRMEEAEEKVRAVQHWTLAIDRAIDEFQRNRNKFAVWLDTDLPKAVAALRRMSEALDDYISLEAPQASGLPTAAPSGALPASTGTVPVLLTQKLGQSPLESPQANAESPTRAADDETDRKREPQREPAP
jgi:DNA repair exonuclease SbcCD ATPase subunit